MNRKITWLMAVLAAMLFSPGHASALKLDWCTQAVSSHENNLSDATIQAYDKCLEMREWGDEERAMIVHQRGLARQELGDLEGAIVDFTMALEHVPTPEVSYSARGLAYLGLGDNERALRDFNAAIEHNANIWLTYYLRGLVHDNQGNDQDALKDYSRALELNPDNPELLTVRAQLRAGMGDLAGAIDDYSEVILLEPENAAVHNGRAWNRFLLETDLEQALLDVEYAIALDGEEFNFADTRAHLLSSLGREDEALVWFEKAGKLGGSDLVIWYQRELKAKGFYGGALDGDMGSGTLAALKACIRADCRLLAFSEP